MRAWWLAGIAGCGPGAAPAGAWLLDQDGQRVSLDDLLGQPVIMDIGSQD